MSNPLIILLLALGGATLVGALIAFLAFRRAQHGFEDEEGFHRGDRTKRRRPKR